MCKMIRLLKFNYISDFSGAKDVLKQIKKTSFENLKCSVCQEIFIDAVVIECGHTFCKHCIEEWQKKFIEENPDEEPYPCPECRAVFKTFSPNINVNNFIDDLTAVILDEEEKKDREETINERLEKKNNPPIPGANRGAIPINNLELDGENIGNMVTEEIEIENESEIEYDLEIEVDSEIESIAVDQANNENTRPALVETFDLHQRQQNVQEHLENRESLQATPDLIDASSHHQLGHESIRHLPHPHSTMDLPRPFIVENISSNSSSQFHPQLGHGSIREMPHPHSFRDL